jgi:hypothetical protein
MSADRSASSRAGCALFSIASLLLLPASGFASRLVLEVRH